MTSQPIPSTPNPSSAADAGSGTELGVGSFSENSKEYSQVTLPPPDNGN